MGKTKQEVREQRRLGQNQGPARDRYWRTDRLMKHKIRNLMRHNGLTRAEAYLLWTSARQGRRRTY